VRRLGFLLALFALGIGTVAAAPQDRGEVALSVASFEDAWQTINDSYYDPTFGGVDWPAVRRELLPRAKAARSADEVRTVIRDMIDRLGRSHFELLSDATALPGAGAIPIDIRIHAGEVVVTRVPKDGPAARAGFRPGQVILSVDGTPATSWRPASGRRNARWVNQRHWEAAYRALHGDDESMAVVEVRDPDAAIRQLRVRRDAGSRDLLPFGNLVLRNARLEATPVTSPRGRSAGVIAFNLWMTAVNDPLDRAMEAFRHADGLVIDLRGNPGGLMGMISSVSGHVMAEPSLLGTMRTRTTPPLTFKVNPRLATADGRRVTPYAGPLAILVDEQTASTSEIFTGALQSLGRARVFGRQTMGQALPASTKTLPNGDVLLHAVGDFVTSTGRSLEGDGVVPDEPVPLSIKALADGRDTALEAALNWIDRARPKLLCSGDLQGTQSLPRWVAPLMRP
jgi:carboxyl-terminal processing protease